MRIFLYEIKKILNPVLIAAVIAVYIFAVFAYPGPVAYINTAYRLINAPEEGEKTEAVETADLLLERYGAELTASEIEDFKAFTDKYIENLNSAIAENEYCKAFGVTDYTQLTDIESFLGDEYYELNGGVYNRVKTDEFSEFFEKLSKGEIPLTYNGEDYYVTNADCYRYNAQLMLDGIAEQGEDYIYHVYIFSSFPMSDIWVSVSMLCAVSVSLTVLLVLPSMVRENRTGSFGVQYTTKKGRKIYGTRFAAVMTVSAVSMASGCAILWYFIEKAGISRFFGCRPDTYIEIYNGDLLGKLYSGVPLGVMLRLTVFAAFVFGVALSGIAYLISARCSNYITAAASGIPIFIIVVLCAERYISLQFNEPVRPLIFAGEPAVILAMIAAVSLVAFVFSYRKTLRSDVK